ncbi:MAG: SoxR reducing system RseC family protein [Bacteroidales bacterium]|nr:SoxR reducing system RseC family protein [Bacteroidales bacterium]MCM1147987.1 SoxR reducing system RseC family protein [Bacteroidales bacterium]MCM1206911.1 SoxR reducing system RseC family protein [Bacillota bacterium]MCM1509545.1 SoxR reducing system RseC family protein [Clostridium sp.]
MNEQIKHEGVIISIEGEHIQVRIAQTSACLHCKIAGHCNSAESKEKIIDIWTRKAARYSVGQDVCVVMGGKMGLKAVFMAFIVPVILAILVITIILDMTSPTGTFPVPDPYDQGYAAIGGMAVFGMYYTALYFCKELIQLSFQFSIEDK